MQRDDELQLALREWGVLCHALAQGQLCASARKGGIHEQRGGLFTLHAPRFWLLPGYEHQDQSRLHPRLRQATLPPAPPAGSIQLQYWAEVQAWWRVDDPELLPALAAAEQLQGLSLGELQLRFAYRDQPWIALLLLRVHCLPQALRLPDLPRYAGCRSWITLEAAQSLRGSRPVLSAPQLAARHASLQAVLGPAQPS